MRNFTMGALGSAAIFLGMAVAGSVSAATIDFGTSAGNLPSYSEDGFTLAPVRLVNGNCVAGSCLALNTDEITTLTFGGLTFSLDGLTFILLGQTAALTITGDTGATTTFTTGTSGHNVYNTVLFGPLFAGVTSIVFDNTGTGNIRIDDVVVSPALAPVPLPATGLLLLAGLGALVAACRRAA